MFPYYRSLNLELFQTQ